MKELSDNYLMAHTVANEFVSEIAVVDVTNWHQPNQRIYALTLLIDRLASAFGKVRAQAQAEQREQDAAIVDHLQERHGGNCLTLAEARDAIRAGELTGKEIE